MNVSRTSRKALQAAAAFSVAACALLCLPAAGAQHTAAPAHSAPAPAPHYYSQPARQPASSSSSASSQSSHPSVIRGGAQPQQFHSAPNEQPAFRAAPPVYRNGQPVGGQAANGQRPYAGPPGHLSQWMQQHQNLSPQQQQQALEREPGFNKLPPQEQARVRARLQQLNAMPPDQRQRVLDRVESMERLTPTQRQQVTSTMGQLHALPPDRQRAVAQAFRNLRQLPPDQREAAAQSYARNFSPQERETLNNLLRAEPYLPVKRPPRYAPPPIQ